MPAGPLPRVGARRTAPVVASTATALLADLDRDGDLDAYVARDTTPNQLYENTTSGGVLELRERGVAAGEGIDFADGRAEAGVVDLAIATIGGPLALLRDTGAGGHRLTMALDRPMPGTVVTVDLADGRRLLRVVEAGGSYLSSQHPRAHFGLGAETSVAVETPDGSRIRLTDVEADQVVTVDVGDS